MKDVKEPKTVDASGRYSLLRVRRLSHRLHATRQVVAAAVTNFNGMPCIFKVIAFAGAAISRRCDHGPVTYKHEGVRHAPLADLNVKTSTWCPSSTLIFEGGHYGDAVDLSSFAVRRRAWHNEPTPSAVGGRRAPLHAREEGARTVRQWMRENKECFLPDGIDLMLLRHKIRNAIPTRRSRPTCEHSSRSRDRRVYSIASTRETHAGAARADERRGRETPRAAWSIPKTDDSRPSAVVGIERADMAGVVTAAVFSAAGSACRPVKTGTAGTYSR